MNELFSQSKTSWKYVFSCIKMHLFDLFSVKNLKMSSPRLIDQIRIIQFSQKFKNSLKIQSFSFCQIFTDFWWISDSVKVFDWIANPACSVPTYGRLSRLMVGCLESQWVWPVYIYHGKILDFFSICNGETLQLQMLHRRGISCTDSAPNSSYGSCVVSMLWLSTNMCQFSNFSWAAPCAKLRGTSSFQGKFALAIHWPWSCQGLSLSAFYHAVVGEQGSARNSFHLFMIKAFPCTVSDCGKSRMKASLCVHENDSIFSSRYLDLSLNDGFLQKTMAWMDAFGYSNGVRGRSVPGNPPQIYPLLISSRKSATDLWNLILYQGVPSARAPHCRK